MDPPGHGLDGQILGQAPGHPRLELAQRLPVRGLEFERSAELRLTARPADEDDQVPSDGQGRLPAEVFLDQGKGDSGLPITPGDVFIPPRCLTEQKGVTRRVPECVGVTADRGIIPGIMSVAVSPVLKR